MVGAAQGVYQGPWRRLVNSAATSAGSIHDDEAARKSGFEGGFVPGSTVGTLALTAILDHYGTRWMEGGWYSLNFVAPVYEHNDVRAVGEPAPGSDDLSVRVETREGRPAALAARASVKSCPGTRRRMARAEPTGRCRA